MGEQKNKKLGPLGTYIEPVRDIVPGFVAENLLILTNRLNRLENNMTSMGMGINQMANDVNKANTEIANKVQVLETRIAELERLQVEKGSSSGSKEPPEDDGSGFQMQH